MFFQGWHPFSTDTLAAAFAGAGGAGVIRMPAFPDSEALATRLADLCRSGEVGLDFRGVLGDFSARMEAAAQNLSAFIMHGSELLPERLEAIRAWGLPRVVEVQDEDQARDRRGPGASALLAAEGEGLAERLKRMIRATNLPCFAPVAGNAAEGRDLLSEGAAGLQLRGPSLLREGAADFLASFRKRLAEAMGTPALDALVEPRPRSCPACASATWTCPTRSSRGAWASASPGTVSRAPPPAAAAWASSRPSARATATPGSPRPCRDAPSRPPA